MDDLKMPKNAKIFICELCNFKCFKNSNYVCHLTTAKHKMMIKDIKKMPKNAKNAQDCFSCECGKIYKHYSGLWRHQNENLCISKNNNENNNENNNISPELIINLLKQNQYFKDLITDQNKQNFELQKQMINSNKIINNNNINNVNSNNKTFNLQFFLNETCKDAMNLSEFIDSVKIQLTDLESVGKLGFVDGISNIIIKNLEALDIEKRPIHCCDSKRETMYIKDQDKWEKEDNELKRMKELVRIIRDRNISMVNTWRDLYPECILSNSNKTTQFNQIYMESFGGEKGTKKEKEEKIISKIAKSVIIDKYE
jgi:hypothetical protein